MHKPSGLVYGNVGRACTRPKANLYIIRRRLCKAADTALRAEEYAGRFNYADALYESLPPPSPPPPPSLLASATLVYRCKNFRHFAVSRARRIIAVVRKKNGGKRARSIAISFGRDELLKLLNLNPGVRGYTKPRKCLDARSCVDQWAIQKSASCLRVSISRLSSIRRDTEISKSYKRARITVQPFRTISN